MKINFGRVSPSFMIIGAQKAGTSSLYNYLAYHSKIITPVEKELHYFDTFQKTTSEEYLKKFPKRFFTKKISFEATPRYLYFPKTAKKIYEFNSKMKFIVILRNPIDRAYSAWNMYRDLSENKEVVARARRKSIENDRIKLFDFLYKNSFPSFEECVFFELSENFDPKIIEPSVVRRGYYKDQIENYLRYFDRSAFLFIDFNELASKTEDVLDDVTRFLEIKPINKNDVNIRPYNKRVYNEKISESTREVLRKVYRKKNQGLEELVGIHFDWNL